jgi:hypothetical protein
MKPRLLKMGILSAGLLCVTQAFAGWSDVTDLQEIRSMQATSAFQGKDVYGRRFVGTFDADQASTMVVDGSSMATRWHFNGSAQLCIEWQEGTECYRVQKSEDVQPAYRAVRVRDGEAMPLVARQERSLSLSALSR